MKYSRDPALLKRLGINAPSAEGYLFPDTYVIAEGLDAREVIAAELNRPVPMCGLARPCLRKSAA